MELLAKIALSLLLPEAPGNVDLRSPEVYVG
jgi:hypothetical protein